MPGVSFKMDSFPSWSESFRSGAASNPGTVSHNINDGDKNNINNGSNNSSNSTIGSNTFGVQKNVPSLSSLCVRAISRSIVANNYNFKNRLRHLPPDLLRRVWILVRRLWISKWSKDHCSRVLRQFAVPGVVALELAHICASDYVIQALLQHEMPQHHDTISMSPPSVLLAYPGNTTSVLNSTSEASSFMYLSSSRRLSRSSSISLHFNSSNTVSNVSVVDSQTTSSAVSTASSPLASLTCLSSSLSLLSLSSSSSSLSSSSSSSSLSSTSSLTSTEGIPKSNQDPFCNIPDVPSIPSNTVSHLHSLEELHLRISARNPSTSTDLLRELFMATPNLRFLRFVVEGPVLHRAFRGLQLFALLDGLEWFEFDYEGYPVNHCPNDHAVEQKNAVDSPAEGDMYASKNPENNDPQKQLHQQQQKQNVDVLLPQQVHETSQQISQDRSCQDLGAMSTSISVSQSHSDDKSAGLSSNAFPSSFLSPSSVSARSRTKKSAQMLHLTNAMVSDLFCLESTSESPLLPSVSYLNFGMCSYLLPSTLRPLLERSSHLRHVMLDGIVDVTDHVVLSLTRHCRQLETISLQGCRRITDAAFGDIGRGFLKSLMHLCVSGCRGVTSVAMALIAEGCPNLRFLDLRWCSQDCYNSAALNDLAMCGVTSSCCPLLDSILICFNEAKPMMSMLNGENDGGEEERSNHININNNSDSTDELASRVRNENDSIPIPRIQVQRQFYDHAAKRNKLEYYLLDGSFRSSIPRLPSTAQSLWRKRFWEHNPINS